MRVEPLHVRCASSGAAEGDWLSGSGAAVDSTQHNTKQTNGLISKRPCPVGCRCSSDAHSLRSRPLTEPVAALPLRRPGMSRLSLRKQSLPVTVHVSAPAGQASTPWDAPTRASVPDFSSFLEYAQSHCPHLLTPPAPPLPAAAFPTPRSSIAQLLCLTRLQAELEGGRLAAYQRHVSEEHAALVSAQSLNEQLALQQQLLAHLRAVTEEGADGGLACHIRHVAACPSAVLDGLTSEQQTSARLSVSTSLYRACLSRRCQPSVPTSHQPYPFWPAVAYV